jgi:hypothetical protein
VTDDDPLEGDIGPAVRPASKADEERKAHIAEELRRYEAEREARRQRLNAVSARITVVVLALLLGFLTYDSVAIAIRAHRQNDPWLYPPATIATLSLIGLVVLITWTIRHRR